MFGVDPRLRCKLRPCAVIVMALLVAACSKGMDLAVQSVPPAPVITALPVAMGLHYDDKFRSSVHRETSEDRVGWQVDLRQAQRNLFDNVVPPMFQTVHNVPTLTAPHHLQLDGIMAPELLQVQFALPEETQTDFYEAWMKYKIRLYDPAGQPITAWEITGYGKATKAGIFTSKETLLNLAIDEALRSVGAELALGFAQRDDVRRWLCGTAAAARLSCVGAAHHVSGADSQ